MRGSGRTVKVWLIARPFTVKRAVKVPVSRAPSRRCGPPGSAGPTGRQTTRCIPAAVENVSGTGCHSGDTRGSPLAPRLRLVALERCAVIVARDDVDRVRGPEQPRLGLEHLA